MGSPLSVASVAKSLNIGARNTIDDRIDRLCASFYAWRASITHDGVTAVAGGQSKRIRKFPDRRSATRTSCRPRDRTPHTEHHRARRPGVVAELSDLGEDRGDIADRDRGARIDVVGRRDGVSLRPAVAAPVTTATV
jgi:hypothetical protein